MAEAGAAINQTSMARLLTLNGIDDFCLFGPPEEGASFLLVHRFAAAPLLLARPLGARVGVQAADFFPLPSLSPSLRPSGPDSLSA